MRSHDAQKRALRVENRSRKRDRVDTTLRLLPRDIGNVESSRRTRSDKRRGTAIVVSYERGLRRRHDHALSVRDR